MAQPNEETVIVTQTIIKAKCACGGHYVASGGCFESLPPQYFHKCDTCGDSTSFKGGVQYPIIKETIESPSSH